MKLNMNGIKQVQFGTDAEFFLVKDGKIIPASKVIPGTKAEPHVLANGVCHPDGLSLEVGCPPADTPEGMFLNLFRVLDEVREKYLDPQGVQFYDEAVIDVSREDIKSQCTASDLQHGCSYEFFAWSERGSGKKQPQPDVQNLRFSGFHIHLGFTSDQQEGALQIEDMACLARSLDYFMLKAHLGTTEERSKQYGGYGSFRVKPYGIEYRCLDSNAVLQRDKMLRIIEVLNNIGQVFNRASLCTTSPSLSRTYDTQQLKRYIRNY